jgi:hypothetical protein
MSNKISGLKLKMGSAVTALTVLMAANTVYGGITGSDVVNRDGTVTYSYVVDNSKGSFDVAAWSLEFGFSIPDWNQFDNFSGGDVKVPNENWFADPGTPTTGKSAQDFISLGGEGGDVEVGAKLYGFSFTSDFQPGTITFDEFSADGTSSTGTTIGPVNAVPEGNGPFELISFAALAGFAAITRVSRDQKKVSIGC